MLAKWTHCLLLAVWLLPATAAHSQPWRTLGDTRGAFPLEVVALSPDGKLLLAADQAAKRVLVLDASNGIKLRELDAHARSLAFSPDSKLVYTGTLDGKVIVWALPSGQRLRELRAHDLALSANGKVLLLLEHQPGSGPIEPGLDMPFIPPTSVVRFVDPTTWKETAPLRTAPITAVAVAADGKSAAWATEQHVHCVDAPSGEQFRKIPLPKSASPNFASSVAALAWAPDGKTLAAAVDAKRVGRFGNFASTLYLWNSETGQEIKQLDGPEVPVRGLAFTPSGDKLIATGPGRHWQIVSLPDGANLEQTRGTRGHGDLVLALYRQGSAPTAKLSPFLTYLWELARGQDVESGNTPEGLGCLVPLPDGKTVVTGDMGGYLRFWDLPSGKEVRRVREPVPTQPKVFQAIYRLAYSPADQCVVCGLPTGDLSYARADDGKRRRLVRGMGGSSLPFAVARDGTLAVANLDANGVGVRLWPPRAARPTFVRFVAGAVSSLQFSADSKLLLAASWNGLHLIDVPGNKVVRVIAPTTRFGSAALSPDGKTLAALGQFAPGIHLWDQDGQTRGKLDGSLPPADGQLFFSPDGRSLLTQHQDDLVVWEVESGQVRYSAKAPGGLSQGFSPDGRLVFTLTTHLFSVDNKTFDVWDLTGAQTGGVLKPVQYTPQEQAALWADLQSKVDAGRAYRALWRLVADPDNTVAFLADQVQDIRPLDSAKLDNHPAPAEKILAGRIVEVLEQVGTPAARRLLEKLATSAKPQFTDAARQALARLKDR